MGTLARGRRFRGMSSGRLLFRCRHGRRITGVVWPVLPRGSEACPMNPEWSVIPPCLPGIRRVENGKSGRVGETTRLFHSSTLSLLHSCLLKEHGCRGEGACLRWLLRRVFPLAWRVAVLSKYEGGTGCSVRRIPDLDAYYRLSLSCRLPALMGPTRLGSSIHPD